LTASKPPRSKDFPPVFLAEGGFSVYVRFMLHEWEYADALTTGPIKGRGAGLNPGNRFEDVRLHVLGEYLDEIRLERENQTVDGSAPGGEAGPSEAISLATRVYHDRSRTVLNHVESPDIGFSWTVNPYRGCEHGCIYCYARPGHEYLGWSCGVDFETRILAKVDAPDLLREALLKPTWNGEPIVVSGVTDPYQPVERRLRITRRVLEVCRDLAQPVSLITKNSLIARDVDLLGDLARHQAASAAISVTTLDNELASRMEPRASAPSARLNAIRTLAQAGVPVSVMVAPIIPSINDHEIAPILEAAAEAGARNAGYVMLRLPHQNKDLFLDWLRRHFPDRAARVESQVRAMHGGELYDARWFKRQRGEGPLARQIERAFEVFKKRAGFSRPAPLLGQHGPGSDRADREAGRNDEFLRRKRDRDHRGQGLLFS